MNVWTRRAVFVSIAIFASICGVIGIVYYVMWQKYDAAMQIMEPRISRVQGVVNSQKQIEAALKTAEGVLLPWLHPSSADVQNRVQQQLRQLIDSTATTAVASQAAFEGGDGEKMARVLLTATLVGEWANVVKLLELLQVQKPLFWVRSATFMRETGNPTAEPQTVRLTIQLEAPLTVDGVAQ